MNTTSTSSMAHQKPLHHHQLPLMEPDKPKEIIQSSSSFTGEMSQEHVRLPAEASNLGEKQCVEPFTRLPSGASDSDKKQSVSSIDEQQREHREKEHEEADGHGDENGRERLRRHRREVAGRVWIPEIWGQEELLKEWIDCSTFDSCLVPTGISSARAALVQEARRASSNGGLRLENRCLILR